FPRMRVPSPSRRATSRRADACRLSRRPTTTRFGGMDMANPVNWFHITSKEHATLAKFYGEAFDWKMSSGPGGMAFADTGRGRIPGGIAGPQDGSEASTIHMYVGTSNIDAQLERIEKAGGRPAGFKQALPPGMGTISAFFDPAGNYVGLWEREAPPRKTAT